MNEIQSCFQRCEKKYMLSREQYLALRLGLAGHMKPDRYPRYSISSVYYDTEQWDLIRASLEKPVYKEKLRLRSYGVPGSCDPVFAELKKKYRGVVYKRRVTLPMADAAAWLAGRQPGDGSQISREIEWFLQFYRPTPKVFIAYEREAWAAADGGELRVTFDSDIRVRSNDLDPRMGSHGTALLQTGGILMEIKIPGAAPLWLARLLSAVEARPTSFSKYGTYYQQFVLGGRSAEVKKEVVLSA